ncbi:MAG TPA: hypothetical protein VFG94_02415 [Acidimicrobiales bacterium]|jgi:hypothetical protein|nr:hypothetical protein [Acidimicrobiales bacterium]
MLRGYPPTAVLFTHPTPRASPGNIETVTDVTDVSDDDLREIVELPPQLDSLYRVWVTPSDRKRCTYVTRDEQPVADSHDNGLLRF